jgi:hypothetical protein
MWSNRAFLFLQEPLAHKQLSLITKTSLRGLDDSQSPPFLVIDDNTTHCIQEKFCFSNLPHTLGIRRIIEMSFIRLILI